MKLLLDLLVSSLSVASVLPASPCSLDGLAPALSSPMITEHAITIVGAGVVAGDPTAPGGAPFTASGHANQLGAWNNVGVLAIDLTTGAATGSVSFVAANGDRLDGTFDGTFDPTTGTAAATFEWTGGSGRFANATGSADFVVVQDPSGSFTFVATGVLDH